MSHREPKPPNHRQNGRPLSEEKLRELLFNIHGDEQLVEELICEIKRKL